MSGLRKVKVGNKEIQLPKYITAAGGSIRLFHHFNLFRLSSNVREHVPGDFAVSSTTGIQGSTSIFSLQGITEENILKLSMLRDMLFPEVGTEGPLHPLVASRILHLYEIKHQKELDLLNGLLDQGYDKEFRIERFRTSFCPKVKRRVEEVTSACVLKVSELRALHRDRHKRFMALVEASSSAVSGGGSSGGGGRDEKGGKKQDKKRGREGGKRSAGASSAGSSRATPNSRSSSNAGSKNAGDETKMSMTPAAQILPPPPSSNGDGEASQAAKRKRSLAPGDDATGFSGGTPARSTPGEAGRKPGSTRRRSCSKDKEAGDYGNQGGRGQVGSPLEGAEKNKTGEEATAGLIVKVSSDAEVRREKWLAAVEENDRRFEEVEERVRREIAKAEEVHRARNLELFRWSVDEQRGKHVGSGSQGPPPMLMEPGDSVSLSSISSSAVLPSSAASAVAANPGSLSDVRLRAEKYLLAVEENDVRLRNRKKDLQREEELAKKGQHARSLELFAWDVEERMGKHDALGSDGPPAIV